TPAVDQTGAADITVQLQDDGGVANGGDDTSAPVTFTITVNASGVVSVDVITPNIMQAGTTIDVTITGSGFVIGANVTLENGNGPAPTASNIIVADGTTLTANLTAKGSGPPRDRLWDVRVTNLDGSTGVLEGGFTVTP
ncbi:MAG: hypothetical protein OES12_08415, partial [Anaerolineae bacterium]|nr:hypothetical protein [Anaerolineae bacterium]